MLPNRGGGKKRLASIKSREAMMYTNGVQWQAREQMIGKEPLLGPLRIKATIYYRTQRPDLDGEAICDALQGIVYANDRQLREKHWIHAIDKQNPRAEIVLEALPAEPQAERPRAEMPRVR